MLPATSTALGVPRGGPSTLGYTGLGLATGLVSCVVAATVQNHHGGLDWIWAFRGGEPVASRSVWLVVGLVVLVMSLVTTLAERASGRARLVVWGALWAAGVAATFAVLFGNHGGDSTNNLYNHITTDRTDYPLFVGGELLGYLWYWAVERLLPGEVVPDLFMAARIAGWIGWLGMLVCAHQIAQQESDPTPITRGLIVAVACVLPYVILFGAYPQSSSLMLALVPIYLALGLATLGSLGSRARWYAAGAGTILALACTAHGAAYFLGISAAFVVVRSALSRRFVVATLFAVTFLVVWVALTLVEQRLILLAEDTPWSVMTPDYDAERLWANMCGPIGLAGPSPYYGGRTYGQILAAWMASTTPAAPVMLVVAAIGWLRLRLSGGVRPAGTAVLTPVDALLFLGTAALGCLTLWSIWDAWYGYPSDWDTTIIASLTLHLFALTALVTAPPGRLRQITLGFSLPVQAFVLVQLALVFAGPSKL